MQSAPKRGALAVQSKGDLDLADISHRAASPQDLIAELDAARRRRDKSLELWVLAIDLRELLWCESISSSPAISSPSSSRTSIASRGRGDDPRS